MLSIGVMLIMGLILGAAYRINGGADSKLLNVQGHIMRYFISVVYAIVGTAFWVHSGYSVMGAIEGLITMAMSLIFLSTGRGQWQNLNPLFYMNPQPPAEKLDALIVPFFGIDPRTTVEYAAQTSEQRIVTVTTYGLKKMYWRCWSGLFLNSALIGLGLGIDILATGHVLAGLSVVLGFGLFSAMSYSIGWKLWPNENAPASFPISALNQATKLGEAGSGFFAGLIVGYLILLIA